MATPIKSPVYIFYGEDDFTLLKRIERWKDEFAKKFTANGVVQISGEGQASEALVSQLSRVAAPSLFAGKQLVICKDCLPSKAAQEDLGDLIAGLAEKPDANNIFVFYASKSLDKRLGSIKKILKSPANIMEFTLPHGNDLNAWIKAYAKTLGSTIDEPGINKLAVFLGRDLYEEKKFGGKVAERKEAFNLWQAHSELSKLAAHSPAITAGDVESLVQPKVSENIFNLSDEIFRKNKSRALSLVENLFADQSSDEKSTAIKITALLAEQVRALLLVMMLKEKRMDNDQIAETLGWNSGRVFMVGKQSGGVKVGELKSMLLDLIKIDLSLKSTDYNSKLALDSFVAKFA